MQTTQSNPEQNTAAIYWPAVIIFCAVLVCCFIGIWSRPSGFLANVWPANAVMLGLLLRIPSAARWSGWLAGAFAYIAADLMTGSDLFKAVLLNSANLASIAVAYHILVRLPNDVVMLKQPRSMLYIAFAAILGGGAAGLIGGAANPILFDADPFTGFIFWWVGEVVNYIAILPILLSASGWQELRKSLVLRHISIRRDDALPALAVVFSCFMAFVIGGEGAIAFPILPLLWCGLVYPVFPTAVLTFLSSSFALIFVFSGHYATYIEEADNIALISVRLGASVVTIAPILLAITTKNRNELLAELRYISTHDSLTGVGSRGAFRTESERLLNEVKGPHALLMIDLDHFKSINDTHGHSVGDEVLRQVASRISNCLRVSDQLGRMGGEEFAVFLAGCEPSTAREISERIRTAISNSPVVINHSLAINVTTSIGLACIAPSRSISLDLLLTEADLALYKGKASGRNCVIMSAPEDGSHHMVSDQKL